MTLTANTYQISALPNEGLLFYKSLSSEDVTGCEEVVAAVSGATHYITDVLIRTDAAMDISLGSGESTDAITTVHLGPAPLDAASGIFIWKAPPGMGLRCTSDTAFTIDSTAAGTLWLEVRGKTCRNAV